MKNILTLAVILFATSATFANPLACRGTVQSNEIIGGITAVDISSTNFDGSGMNNIVVKVRHSDYNGSRRVVTGRAAFLEADQNYNPRVYKNHIRFDLRKLTTVSDFSSYTPADYCRLSLMIPKNRGLGDTFQGAMVINCDQSGGSITVLCHQN